MMNIYLHTKSFEDDYQWFSLGADNSVLISENFWETEELIKKAPISDEEFSLLLGRNLKSDFLLASDLDSGRLDYKENVIKNTFLFVSEDEVFLRKITASFIFNHGDISYDLNSLIVENSDEKYGFTIDYSKIMNALDQYLKMHEVEYEFDAMIDGSDQRFAELFEINNNAESEDTKYFINPIFEEKVKKYLLAEIFPDDTEMLFLYTPKLSLMDIKKSGVYVSVAKELDHMAKSIFKQKSDDWAETVSKNKKFDSTLKAIGKTRTEWFLLVAIAIIAVPIGFSYFDMNSKISGFIHQNRELKKDIIALESEKKDNVDNLKSIESEKKILEEKIKELEGIISGDQKTILTLEKKIRELSSSEKIQVVQTKTIQIQPDQQIKELRQCENRLAREKKQRGKLAIGYRWYKDLYNNCKSALQEEN
jgi:hypothetical protein